MQKEERAEGTGAQRSADAKKQAEDKRQADLRERQIDRCARRRSARRVAPAGRARNAAARAGGARVADARPGRAGSARARRAGGGRRGAEQGAARLDRPHPQPDPRLHQPAARHPRQSRGDLRCRAVADGRDHRRQAAQVERRARLRRCRAARDPEGVAAAEAGSRRPVPARPGAALPPAGSDQ